MFNALNRFISRLDGEAPPAARENHGGFGFQVLRNTNRQLAIEPWFDFVVGINGRMIVREPRQTTSAVLVAFGRLIPSRAGRLGPEALRPGGAQLRRRLRHARALERESMYPQPPRALLRLKI